MTGDSGDLGLMIFPEIGRGGEVGGGVQVSSVSAARLWEPAYLITLSFVTTIIYTSNCSNFKWILNNTTLKVVAVLYCL